jgi:4-amino-4-deoxy-L-arabinose transferase-like glycosyltransferase
MVLTLTLLAWAIWREVDSRHALWTCFILASSLLTIYCAKMSTTDSVLLLWTTVALISIYALWQGRGGWVAVIMLSGAIGLAGLVKGPFILGVIGGTMGMLLILGAFDHWRQRASSPLSLRERARVRAVAEAPLSLHPSPLPEGEGEMLNPSRQMNVVRATAQTVVGLLIVMAIVGPWLYLVQHREPNFIRASTADAMAHMEHGSEGHWGPPGYHLALIWVTFLPWSILLPLAIVLAFRNRREPHVRFALAAALGTWIFVEILGTKLPHYILSAFPALTFVVADAVIRCLRGEQPDMESRSFKIAGVATALVILGSATVPWWWLAFRFHDFPWTALLATTCGGVTVASLVTYFFLSNRPAAGAISMGIGSLALGAVLFGIYLPSARPLQISIRVAQILRERGAIHPGDVQMLDYKEPSLGFYQGGTIREADRFIPSVQYLPPIPNFLVMTRDLWNQATPQQRATLPIVGEPVVGLNYSDSIRPVEVLVVRNELAHEAH